MVASPEALEPVTALRNIGPRSARRLREAGIVTVADLERVGAVEAYRRIDALDPRGNSIVFLYALEAALLGISWTLLPPDLRAQLREEARGAAN